MWPLVCEKQATLGTGQLLGWPPALEEVAESLEATRTDVQLIRTPDLQDRFVDKRGIEEHPLSEATLGLWSFPR